MESLSDEFLNHKPDKYMVAWFSQQINQMKQGYRGATHAINRCLAENADAWESSGKLNQRCETLERERDEANEKVGELQAKLVAMEERLDKMADWIKANVPKNGNEGMAESK